MAAEDARDDVKQVRITLPAAGVEESSYANGVLVNYTGVEFILTFYRALPQPFFSSEGVPDEVQAQVVARIVMPPEKWREAVTSFARQFDIIQQRQAPADERAD